MQGLWAESPKEKAAIMGQTGQIYLSHCPEKTGSFRSVPLSVLSLCLGVRYCLFCDDLQKWVRK